MPENLPETQPLLQHKTECYINSTSRLELWSDYLPNRKVSHTSTTNNQHQNPRTHDLEIKPDPDQLPEKIPEYSSKWKYGQYVAAIIVTSSLFMSGELFGWPSGALPKIDDGTAGYTLTDLQKSLLVGLTNLGSVIGPIPCGYIMDRIGRKTTLTYCIGLIMVSWLILAFSKTIWLIMCARFFMGLWTGVSYGVSIYIAEVVDPDVRAPSISMACVMLYMGVLYISGISFTSYQTMTLLCLIPPALLFFGFLIIPESPYFFLMHCRRDDARKSIEWLKGECHSEDLDRIETAVKEQLTKQGSFKEIFTTASNRKGFFTVECMQVSSASSATLLLFPYSTELLPYGWLTPQQSFVVLCIVWVASSLISGALMYRFKRRSLMMVSSVGAMTLLCITASWYYLRDFSTINTTMTSWLPLVLLCIVAFFESIGIIYITGILMGELFPMNIKTKACALAGITSRGVEAINYLIFYPINSHIGMWFNLFKCAITAGFCLFIVLFVMIETKGKSLEAIQDILEGRNRPTCGNKPPKSMLPFKRRSAT